MPETCGVWEKNAYRKDMRAGKGGAAWASLYYEKYKIKRNFAFSKIDKPLNLWYDYATKRNDVMKESRQRFKKVRRNIKNGKKNEDHGW